MSAVTALKAATNAPKKLKTPTAFLKSMMRSVMAESGLEPRLKSVFSGHVHFELDVEKDLTTVHGGVMASLVDFGGSLAVASTGRFYTGVSTDLSVTYLSPGGKIGDLLRGHAVCEKIGKTLAFTTVQFFDGENRLAARGSHTKYVGGKEYAEENLYTVPPQYELPTKQLDFLPPSLINPYPREAKMEDYRPQDSKENSFSRQGKDQAHSSRDDKTQSSSQDGKLQSSSRNYDTQSSSRQGKSQASSSRDDKRQSSSRDEETRSSSRHGKARNSSQNNETQIVSSRSDKKRGSSRDDKTQVASSWSDKNRSSRSRYNDTQSPSRHDKTRMTSSRGDENRSSYSRDNETQSSSRDDEEELSYAWDGEKLISYSQEEIKRISGQGKRNHFRPRKDKRFKEEEPRRAGKKK
ncbi:hypothetical protein HIM_01978 [Hirsutella minnesotensis 3608]|nr:hypothetical protein HIM_01978 [Hirsutella minnesotensis 3608]